VQNDPKVIAAYLGVDDDEVTDLIDGADGEIGSVDQLVTQLADVEPSDAVSADRLAGGLDAPRNGAADNLTLIKGIGSVNETKLNAHGIYHFDQIAAWTDAGIKQAETYLSFDGRISREDWVGQAKKLSQGEATEFSTRVESGKVPSSHETPAEKASSKKSEGGK
jgi:branched-chain amino acid transport system ATP-binding protein